MYTLDWPYMHMCVYLYIYELLSIMRNQQKLEEEVLSNTKEINYSFFYRFKLSSFSNFDLFLLS